MTDEQQRILTTAGITGVTDVARYGSGHINETYKVETASGERYILQKINTSIFTRAELLKANVLRVTEYLQSRGVPSLEVVAYENPWRVYRFLEGYTSRDIVSEPRQAYDVGRAFAKFQNDLAELPAPRLGEILPKFHDTPDRLRQLDEAAAQDVKGRRASVAAELAFVDTWRERAGRIVELMRTGEIPERVTHNDTKINNVLFAPDTHEALLVIDLDTVMPGLVAHDFGDAVRFAANFTEEDSEHTDKTGLDLNIFWAFADGFLSKTASVLTPKEIDTLALSPFVLACELATRFLDDYIMGDNYFACKKPGHNLIRTRCQVALAKDMEQKIDAMDALIKSCVEKYR